MAPFLLCPYMVQGKRRLPGVPFIRALIAFMKDPLLGPNHPTKAPTSVHILLEIKFQHMNSGGQRHPVHYRDHIIPMMRSSLGIRDGGKMVTFQKDKILSQNNCP